MMILGTVFIDKRLERTETKNRQVVPNGGHLVAIVKSSEDKAAVQLLNDTKTKVDETSGTNLLTLRLAKIKTIPP